MKKIYFFPPIMLVITSFVWILILFFSPILVVKEEEPIIQPKKEWIELTLVTANCCKKQMGSDSTLMKSKIRINPATMCKDKYCALSDSVAKVLKLKFKDKIKIEGNEWYSGVWIYADKCFKFNNRIELYLPYKQIGEKIDKIKIKKL